MPTAVILFIVLVGNYNSLHTYSSLVFKSKTTDVPASDIWLGDELKSLPPLPLPFGLHPPPSKIFSGKCWRRGEKTKRPKNIFQTYLAIYRAWRLKHIVRPTAVILFIVFKSKTRDVPSDKWLWGGGGWVGGE